MYSNQYLIPGHSPDLESIRATSLNFRQQSHLVFAESFKKIKNTDELLSSFNNRFKKLNEVKIIKIIENIVVQKVEEEPVATEEPEHVTEIISTPEAKGILFTNEPLMNYPDSDYRYELDIDNVHEIRFWSKQLNVSRPEIIKAIEVTKSKCWKVIRDYFISPVTA